VESVLSKQIAEKVHAKVSSLVHRQLSVVDPNGAVKASSDADAPATIDLSKTPWSVSFNYGGKVVGHIVLTQPMPNQADLAPLIRSIAELVMHQSILIEQIPKQEERLDKFIYDILNRPITDEPIMIAEARLFDIDLSHPRIAIVVSVEDPTMIEGFSDPTSDREIRIARYKAGIDRGLRSFYTSSSDNIVSYIGQNNFSILKDLASNGDLEESLESFKRSINTIFDIIKSELKVPTTVGVGNYHPGLAGLRQSYQEALSAIDDFGVVAPLLSGVDENNIYFSRELLDRLGENTEIIQTLESFFNYDMSLTRTADELKIHRNTLVYRLDRITDTLGLDPRHFDDAVQIKLAILFTRFVEK
jgi:carbohydrate diacid regulator